MDEQNPRKRRSPTSPLDYDDDSEGDDHHPNLNTSLSSPSPTSVLPLLPEFPPSAATPTDQLSSPHESSETENDTINQPSNLNTSLSPSTSEPPPLPSSPSSSTLSLLPEIPLQPPSATPTDGQLSSAHESSNRENDTIDQNTSLSSTSESPPLPPSSTSSSTPPLLPEIPPSATPTTDQPSSQSSDQAENDTIDPPYPWATNRRATVHNLEYLTKNGMNKIEGEVECKKCNNKYKRVFDLEEKFKKIAEFMIIISKDSTRERVLRQWLTPDLGGGCDSCGKKGRLRPVIPKLESGQEINWLFLLLGQMLRFCGMDQLKYFCKHTKVPRLGAEDRLIYLAYLGLCKQLDPASPAFDS